MFNAAQRLAEAEAGYQPRYQARHRDGTPAADYIAREGVEKRRGK